MLDDIDTDISDLEISDDELTALALAADPDLTIEDGTVPFHSLHPDGEQILPDWYMPAATRRARSDWRALVAVAIAVGLVLINAFAICVTYGFPEIP